jgi:hypothetical protein
MAKPLIALASLSMVAVCVALQATSQETTVAVRLRLLDAKTGDAHAGIVRVLAKDSGKPMSLLGLYNRLRGLKVAEEFSGWHVVPLAGATLKLRRGQYRIEALAGLETQRATRELDLRHETPDALDIPLAAVFRPEDHGLVAANTHLHLMKLTKEDAEEYLRQIPAADRLRVLFISYLERHKDDAEYITNRYPIGDLPALSATGVLVNNGQEHRHNFGSHGEGYGHVMFLNINDLVKPVSLGPGITGGGNDDRPLRPGIDEARKQGGTVIWCHNSFGHEDVLSALTGRLHALNVFDGSRRGSFEESYYRYLNVGLRMPISTGTDWFIYDFARVYAKVERKLSIAGWLDALKAGRNQATNGPLLSLTVDGQAPGDTLRVAQAKSVKIEAAAVGRHDFQELQLIHNGKVIRKARAQGKAPYHAKLTYEVRVEQSGWFATRIESATKNELGYQLFAHTSPVYVELAGGKIFDVDAAQALLKQIEDGQAAIQKQGKFSDPETERNLLALYTQAADELRDRINRRGRTHSGTKRE